MLHMMERLHEISESHSFCAPPTPRVNAWGLHFWWGRTAGALARNKGDFPELHLLIGRLGARLRSWDSTAVAGVRRGHSAQAQARLLATFRTPSQGSAANMDVFFSFARPLPIIPRPSVACICLHGSLLTCWLPMLLPCNLSPHAGALPKIQTAPLLTYIVHMRFVNGTREDEKHHVTTT